MMLEDVVVDTNVFMHSQTPSCEHFEDSNRFISLLLAVKTKLCVDSGFDISESKNESLITAEYLSHLMVGSAAYAVLVELFSSARVKEVGLSLPEKYRRKINQMIRKPRDRTFLRVAFNSTTRTLVSHDFEDFQEAKRPAISKIFNVDVIEACDCSGLL